MNESKESTVATGVFVVVVIVVVVVVVVVVIVVVVVVVVIVVVVVTSPISLSSWSDDDVVFVVQLEFSRFFTTQWGEGEGCEEQSVVENHSGVDADLPAGWLRRRWNESGDGQP